MKKLVIGTLAAVVLLNPVFAGGTLYKIYTNRLDCDFCAYDVEQKIRKIKGVIDFEVDLDGVFLVTTAPGTRLSEPRIKKILLDDGFDYKGMKSRPLPKEKGKNK